jgi:hypothetical protein
MARGSSQATSAATSAQNLSNSLEGNASSLYGTVAPQLEAEAAAPSGYAPADLAAMNTAAQQSAGGSQAGAVGQGALLAARTRNAGAPAAAIGQSTRTAGQQLSNAALGTQTANARLKEQQRQAGLTGEENLYGRDLGAGVQALGEVAPAVNANTNEENASWDWSKDILAPLLQAGGAAAPTIAKAFGG